MGQLELAVGIKLVVQVEACFQESYLVFGEPFLAEFGLVFSGLGLEEIHLMKFEEVVIGTESLKLERLYRGSVSETWDKKEGWGPGAADFVFMHAPTGHVGTAHID